MTYDQYGSNRYVIVLGSNYGNNTKFLLFVFKPPNWSSIFIFKLHFQPNFSKTTASVYNRIAHEVTRNQTVLLVEILFHSWFPKRLYKCIHQ